MKTVLIHAYECTPYHRPGSTIGAQRPYQFAKHLPKFGWRAIVLCCDYSRRYSLDTKMEWQSVIRNEVCAALANWDRTKSLTIPLPSLMYADTLDKVWLNSVKIDHKIGIFLPKNGWKIGMMRRAITFFKLFRGDHSQSWQKVAICASKEILRQGINIDIQIAEHGPDAGVFIARKIFRDHRVPWVIDFRDPVLFSFKGLAYNVMRFLYPILFRTARATINVNENWVSNDKNLFHKPAYEISNGFDEEEFFLNSEIFFSPRYSITFFYPGNIYPPGQRADDFFFFLKELMNVGFEFQFIYCGNSFEYFKQLSEKFAVEKYCVLMPNIARKDVISYYSQSDYLVIFPLKDTDSPYYYDGFIPGKFLEFIGSRKPILCFSSTDSILERTLKKVGNGIVFKTPLDAKRWFLNKDWKDNLPPINWDERNKFSREYLSKILANILNKYHERTKP